MLVNNMYIKEGKYNVTPIVTPVSVNNDNNNLFSENRKNIFIEIDKQIQKLTDEWLKDNPKPFEIGDQIMYDYYGDPFKSKNGWFGSPKVLWDVFGKELKNNRLNGPFILPVHKVFINNMLLNDLILQHIYISDNELLTTIKIENLISEQIEFINNSDNNFIEWAVDFNWSKLKIAYDDTKIHDSKPKGWLDLKWGGFSACEFIKANDEYCKQSQELFKKELLYIKSKKDYEDNKTKLKQK